MSPKTTTKKTTARKATTKTTAATKKTAKKTAKAGARKSGAFTDAEIDAMKERAREMKKARSGKADGEADLLAKVAEMPAGERAMATRIHAIVKEVAPALVPKTWYGMPAWATRDGKVVCFFQSAAKFKARYATFGFSDQAQLDEGSMWPTSFALTALDAAGEKKIAALVGRATG